VRNSQVRPEVKMLIGLWRLAHAEGYAQIGERFGVGTATAHKCTMKFCEAVVERYSDEWISLPTGVEIQTCIAKMSKRAGLPQAALAVDGCHIPITAPKENPEDYFNRKGFYSINMQGVVDADARFRSVQVNLPGRTHDAKAWSVSDAKKVIEQNFSRSEYVVEVEGRRIKPYVLGDSAYPGSEHLLKPYLQSSANGTDKRRFNLRHCRSRQIVEQAFGILKCMWRLLLRTQEVHKQEILQLLVLTCCTLHNMCVEDRVRFDVGMINEQARQYVERYGGFVVDPNFLPNTDRNANMDGIRTSLTRFLSNRAAELGLVEPRLAQHDHRVQEIEHGLPAARRRAGMQQNKRAVEFGEDADGEYADGGYRNAFFY
jgi:DDE superfamily endonuclease